MFFLLPRLGTSTLMVAKTAAGRISTSSGGLVPVFSYDRLHVPEDPLFSPPDLKTHVEEKLGTKTWWSPSHGDLGIGEYLRRYGNGTFAIHLKTWWSESELTKEAAKRQADGDVAIAAFIGDALLELRRRQSRLSP